VAKCSRLFSTVGENAIASVLRRCFPRSRTIHVSDVSGGCGAMYRVFIESEDFHGMSVLAQHRAVKEALKKEIANMHGITVVTRE
ncbi:BolA-like protein 3, partial [Paragonimus westermani]